MSTMLDFSRRIATVSIISMCLYGSASACSISKVAGVQLPLNTTELSNADRLTIADAVISARQWPEVQIQAVVIAGAYISEGNLEQLKKDRAENVKAYLKQLGIRSENIIIEPKTFTDQMVAKRSDGTLDIEQIVVELTPICGGGCERLCDDPRVIPRTGVIDP
ncbi:hypothetical protein OKW49_002108 [Paraburkholderia youngii]|uniref:hypothetical protein n=1 Tax=Paraburkholderia youngii TaxID=2782701 RepID=UPI003D22DC13